MRDELSEMKQALVDKDTEVAELNDKLEAEVGRLTSALEDKTKAMEEAVKTHTDQDAAASERAGKDATEITGIKAALDLMQQELAKTEAARREAVHDLGQQQEEWGKAMKQLQAQVESLCAELDEGRGEVRIVRAEVVKAQRSCMETQKILDTVQDTQRKLRDERLKKFTARMLWKTARFEFDAWREMTTASLHLLKVSWLEEERTDKATSLEEALATAGKLKQDVSTLEDEVVALKAAASAMGEHATAQDEEKRRLLEHIDMLQSAGEAMSGRMKGERSRLDLQVQALASEVADLKQQLGEARVECGTEQKAKEGAVGTVADKEAEIQKLQDEVGTLMRELDENKSQLEAEVQKGRDGAAMAKKLEDDVNVLEEEMVAQKTAALCKLELVGSKVKETSDALSAKASEMVDLREKLDHGASELAEASQRALAAGVEKTRLMAESEDKSKALQEADNMVQKMRDELSEMKQALVDKDTEVAELNDKLEAEVGRLTSALEDKTNAMEEAVKTHRADIQMCGALAAQSLQVKFFFFFN